MALKRLEEKHGREFASDYIKKQGGVDFNTYPRDDLRFINYRQELNQLINDQQTDIKQKNIRIT